MAEAWRKEEPLTTADLAGTRTRFDAETPAREPVREDFDPDADVRPRLVQNEQRGSATEDRIAGGVDRTEALSMEEDRMPRQASTTEMPSTAGSTPLLSDVELTDLRSRWSNIQTEFVDEPRRSVEQADELVAAAIHRLAEGFARERASLEAQWESGSNVSTEDLRLALQRYRSFFGRLLNAA